MKNSTNFLTSLQKATKMILTIMPMLLAVVGLVGLFNAFVTADMIRSLFNNTILHDVSISVFTGSISVGQPVVSYIVGSELLQKGVSLYAVSAFMLSFVTLGMLQIPLEYSLFGARFTLLRNVLALLFAVLLSLSFTFIYLRIFS